MTTPEKYPDGVRIKIEDINGESTLFLPYDFESDRCFEGAQMTASALFFVAQWMACNRYIPSLDNKCMLKSEDE